MRVVPNIMADVQNCGLLKRVRNITYFCRPLQWVYIPRACHRSPTNLLLWPRMARTDLGQLLAQACEPGRCRQLVLSKASGRVAGCRRGYGSDIVMSSTFSFVSQCKDGTITEPE